MSESMADFCSECQVMLPHMTVDVTCSKSPYYIPKCRAHQNPEPCQKCADDRTAADAWNSFMGREPR